MAIFTKANIELLRKKYLIKPMSNKPVEDKIKRSEVFIECLKNSIEPNTYTSLNNFKTKELMEILSTRFYNYSEITFGYNGSNVILVYVNNDFTLRWLDSILKVDYSFQKFKYIINNIA